MSYFKGVSISEMGQSRRFDPQPITSGLPRSTDILRPAQLVRFVPGRDSHALQQFDGFDGAIFPLVAVAGLSTYSPMCSRLGNGRRTARQDNPKLRELTGLCLDIYRTIVLLDDDVVTD